MPQQQHIYTKYCNNFKNTREASERMSLCVCNCVPSSDNILFISRFIPLCRGFLCMYAYELLLSTYTFGLYFEPYTCRILNGHFELRRLYAIPNIVVGAHTHHHIMRMIQKIFRYIQIHSNTRIHSNDGDKQGRGVLAAENIYQPMQQ